MLGLYDSGIGGTTILQEILQSELKDLDILYYADVKNCPLGDKTDNQILQIVQQAMGKMFDQGCDLVILACSTATSSSIRYLQQEWIPAFYPSKKVLGVIRPICESFRENNVPIDAKIGVMATKATIERGFLEQELIDFGYKNLALIPAPNLADSIEKKDVQSIQLAIENCFQTHKKELPNLDILLLACTHFPLVKKEIEQELKKYNPKTSLQIFDQAKSTTKKLIKYLEKHPEIELPKNKKLRFLQNT